MAYITYLTNADQHTNAASSHPGIGNTKDESVANSRYHANQLPWVRTVPASKAPRSARVAAHSAREGELQAIVNYGYDLSGRERKATQAEIAELEQIEMGRVYA